MSILKPAAIALGIAITAAVGSTANAGDYCPPIPPSCGHYETVMVKNYVNVPYTRMVTQYDHCGRPYQVEKAAVRTVEVVVRKVVYVRN